MGIRTNPVLNVVCRPIIWAAKFVGRNFPETLVRIRYFVRFKKRLNLKSPKTLNEKILNLSLRSDTTEWTRLADKYAVRGYVEECGLADILVPLYGHWDSAQNIDFDSLPQQFVMKTTHGCGDVIVVKDKSQMDADFAKERMKEAISEVYGALEGGKHYMRIKPAIIAEKLLENDEDSLKHSATLIDYKIWCFNGKPQYIMTCTNRKGNLVELQLYDTNWHMQESYINSSLHYPAGLFIPQPKNFENLLQYAEILAKPFPVVRVDLYDIDGKIYFGEMTFTSLGGLMDYYTEEFQLLSGSMIDLNYKG